MTIEVCLKVSRTANGRYSIIECKFPVSASGCQGVVVPAEKAIEILENFKFIIEDEIQRIKEENRIRGDWR